ncbi:MAG: hemerythrin domain-containing protein [Cocleimonas sp.]
MSSLREMNSQESENLDASDIQNKATKQKNILPVYDSSLIGALKSDHQDIIAAYNKVLDTARSGEYSALHLLLIDFSILCTNHHQMEDIRIYGYLKTLASNKSLVEQKVVAKFSSEMNDISTSIYASVFQSPNVPVNDETADSFIKEFSLMGFNLQDRIEREESILYPIYEQSGKVVSIY